MNTLAHTIGIGESLVIPQREITEEMHDRRVMLGLSPKNELENGEKAKILRAYTRPRRQEAVEIEVSETGVRVTALAKGYALIDVVDEISEPAGYDTEVYVVRKVARYSSGTPLSNETPTGPSQSIGTRESIATSALPLPDRLKIVGVTTPDPMEVESEGHDDIAGK